MMVRRPLPVVQPAPAPPAAPLFEKIGIVGLGVVGGSLALAARKTWPDSLVIGLDDKEVLEQAMLLHAIDVGADDPVVLAEVDLVVLAAPVGANLDLIDVVGEHVRTPAVVTDVGATKRAILERAGRLPAHLQFVGGHPLAGAPRQGIRFARDDLFAGRPWILTPQGDATGAAVERLVSFAAALGARPRILAPDEHDRLIGAINHLPHLAASALMHMIGERVGDEGLALAGRGLVDTTRLASSPASVWTDVCRTNADQLGEQLDQLIAVLQAMRDGLESETLVAGIFESANEWRARLLATRST
jgi:prephenate dehydrogenase